MQMYRNKYTTLFQHYKQCQQTFVPIVWVYYHSKIALHSPYKKTRKPNTLKHELTKRKHKVFLSHKGTEGEIHLSIRILCSSITAVRKLNPGWCSDCFGNKHCGLVTRA